MRQPGVPVGAPLPALRPPRHAPHGLRFYKYYDRHSYRSLRISYRSTCSAQELHLLFPRRNPRRGAPTGTPANSTLSEPARHPRDVCANRACLSARPYLPRGLCAMRRTDFDFTSTTIDIPIVVLVLHGNYTCYFCDGTHVGARRQARPRNRFRPNQPGTRATYAPTGRACRRAPTCLTVFASCAARTSILQVLR